MAASTLTIRLDSELKMEASEVAEYHGLGPSSITRLVELDNLVKLIIENSPSSLSKGCNGDKGLRRRHNMRSLQGARCASIGPH